MSASLDGPTRDQRPGLSQLYRRNRLPAGDTKAALGSLGIRFARGGDSGQLLVRQVLGRRRKMCATAQPGAMARTNNTNTNLTHENGLGKTRCCPLLIHCSDILCGKYAP